VSHSTNTAGLFNNILAFLLLPLSIVKRGSILYAEVKTLYCRDLAEMRLSKKSFSALENCEKQNEGGKANYEV